jgi:hypothetical protein
LQQLADGLGKGVLSNQGLPAARIITWAGFDPGTLGRSEKIGYWRPV